MAQEYNAEIGRALGWDLAYYGWDPRDDAPADVIEGHTAGKAHFGSRRKPPDRFERKWLQLRQNALRRGRVVDEGVTADYIRLIDHPICPVTLCEMTHGVRLDTDWSVDRVHNDGAYADGNLVIMSVRANSAKASKTYAEVEALANGRTEADGLSSDEWSRLRCIMLGACNAKTTEEFKVPLLTRIPNRCVRPSYFQLQHITLLIAQNEGEKYLAPIRRLNGCQLDRDVKEHLKQAVRRLKTVLNTVDYKYDACRDEQYQKLLRAWDVALPSDHRPGYKLVMQSMVGGQVLANNTIETWSLGTGGYY
ncbi:UNVERIFIED_ORG: hypothetical protein BDU10_2531 [Burkholderia sp. CF145]